MTSLAFILGIVPLIVAEGAGAASRRSLGTAVFGGMLVSTFLNLYIVPTLYALTNKFLGRNKKELPTIDDESAVAGGERSNQLDRATLEL
jgi:HAE1 family hydrophobic/amphiphilic exporter-1